MKKISIILLIVLLTIALSGCKRETGEDTPGTGSNTVAESQTVSTNETVVEQSPIPVETPEPTAESTPEPTPDATSDQIENVTYEPNTFTITIEHTVIYINGEAVPNSDNLKETLSSILFDDVNDATQYFVNTDNGDLKTVNTVLSLLSENGIDVK